MFFAKLKAAMGLIFFMGLAAMGVRAVTVNASPQPPPAYVPRQSISGARAPTSSNLLAAAAQTRTQRKHDSPAEVDEALVRLVDGHIAKSLPITKDCMVLSYMPDWAHGNVDNIAIANNDGGVRTLLNWEPISLSDANAPNRRFMIALYSRKTEAAGKPGPILAFEITEPWPEQTCWVTQPEYASEPDAQYKFVTEEGWKLFDVSSMVRSQLRGGGTKHGILLRWMTEDRSGVKKNWSGYQFVSREGQGQWMNRRPLLLVVEPTK
jgi:hypothetical protein